MIQIYQIQMITMVISYYKEYNHINLLHKVATSASLWATGLGQNCEYADIDNGH